MTSFGDALEKALSAQASENYPQCREDSVVTADCPYDHPPVLHFVKEFSFLPGAVSSLSIDGLRDPTKRFDEIGQKGAELFSKCSGLKRLSLQYIHLRSFEGLGRHLLLRSLNMQGNKIETFKGLLHMPSLEELNLWGNFLNGFKFFPCLPKLRELDLTCNCIKGGLHRLVARATALRSLRLQMNPLEDASELLPLLDLPDLDFLDLSGCPVSKELATRGGVFLEKLQSRGVRVVLAQHTIPQEMLCQLEELKRTICNGKLDESQNPALGLSVLHSIQLNGNSILSAR